MSTLTLDTVSIEAVAQRVAELLGDEDDVAGGLIDATEVARRFGVARSWAYDHADELGAIRLGPVGEGKKPRLRFHPAIVHDKLAARPAPVTTPSRARQGKRRSSATNLLPIRGPR